MLENLIHELAQTDAAAGKWSAVANAVNAATREVRDDKPVSLAQLAEILTETKSLDAIKDRGIKLEPRAGRIVTAEECEESWTLHKAQGRDDQYRERFDAILNQLGTAEQTAGIEALRTMADEMGAK